MGAKHFDKLDDEGRALSESWQQMARVVGITGALAALVWAACALLRQGARLVRAGARARRSARLHRRRVPAVGAAAGRRRARPALPLAHVAQGSRRRHGPGARELPGHVRRRPRRPRAALRAAGLRCCRSQGGGDLAHRRLGGVGRARGPARQHLRESGRGRRARAAREERARAAHVPARRHRGRGVDAARRAVHRGPLRERSGLRQQPHRVPEARVRAVGRRRGVLAQHLAARRIRAAVQRPAARGTRRSTRCRSSAPPRSSPSPSRCPSRSALAERCGGWTRSSTGCGPRGMGR